MDSSAREIDSGDAKRGPLLSGALAVILKVGAYVNIPGIDIRHCSNGSVERPRPGFPESFPRISARGCTRWRRVWRPQQEYGFLCVCSCMSVCVCVGMGCVWFRGCQFVLYQDSLVKVLGVYTIIVCFRK